MEYKCNVESHIISTTKNCIHNLNMYIYIEIIFLVLFSNHLTNVFK